MKKIDLGQSVALVANVGVILGIVFLAVEISQNTAMIEAQMSQARTEAAMAEAQSIYNSEYIIPIELALESGQPITIEDGRRWSHFFRAFNRNLDNQLRQYEQGLLGENIPRSLRLAIELQIASTPL